MISYINTLTNEYSLAINFVAHFIIFIGCFYVALQNRNLPQWHVAPLWYAGLCSIFICISIILQWAMGPEFVLSYWNVGVLGEIAFNIMIAFIALVMLIRTVLLDLKYKKNRKK